MKTLALFDFDGTITNGDSLVEFLHSMVGYKIAFKRAPDVLLRWIWLLLSGRISHDTAKEALLKVHMPLRTRREWEEAVREFNSNLKPDYYNDTVIDGLRTYRDRGADVAIVSASIDIWLSPFAAEERVELICTRSLWQGDVWAGFDGKNCRGPEKLRRVRAKYPLEEYREIVAYGNSKSDAPMLSLAHKAWMVGRDGVPRPWSGP